MYTTAELRARVATKGFTDRSKAVLLLWFIMYVIVCLCMYVLVIFFIILDSRLAKFLGKKLSFWFSACTV